ncbi:MAG: EAL domain-containing protein [Coprobacillus sp.]|nr:EAL domain-containing protein [Coprobacillus sp.]
MDFGNFSDRAFVIFFSILMSAIVIVLAFCITYGVLHSNNEKARIRIMEQSNTPRVYIVDVKRRVVTYFNRTDLKHKHTMSIDAFYARFHSSDVERVKAWIQSIVEDYTRTEEYLEADIVINRGRKTYFSLLKFLYFDANSGLIHLESLILRYITPVNTAKRYHKGRGGAGVVDKDYISRLINNKKSTTGYTFCIRFFHLKQKILSTDREERFVSMTLRNEIYPFASSPKLKRQIMESREDELFLFDLHMASAQEAISLVEAITHELNKAMELNSFEESVSFAVGIVENSAFYQNFDAIIRESQSAATYAHQENKIYHLHRNEVASSVENNYFQYEDQIDLLLRNDSMKYVFRHIIDVNKPEVMGYFSYVRLYNTSFSSYEEVIHYAYELNKSRDIFMKVSRNIISKFAQEVPQREKEKLFYQVSMTNLDDIIDFLPTVPGVKDIHLVLVFLEKDVYENSEYTSVLVERMKEIKSLGFEIGVLMRDKNLLLDNPVYSTFDYYIVGSSLTWEIKRNTKTRLSTASLIESLLKYHKPIIATDLEGWATIELIIKSGIDLISSEVISYSNEMILPIEEKKLTRLKTIDKIY